MKIEKRKIHPFLIISNMAYSLYLM